MKIMKRVFGFLLWTYAGWQIMTAADTYERYGPTRGWAQVFWAIVAIAGGIYLWRGGKNDEPPAS